MVRLPVPRAVVALALVVLSWPIVSVRPLTLKVPEFASVTPAPFAIWLSAARLTLPPLINRPPVEMALVPAVLLSESVPELTVVRPV